MHTSVKIHCPILIRDSWLQPGYNLAYLFTSHTNAYKSAEYKNDCVFCSRTLAIHLVKLRKKKKKENTLSAIGILPASLIFISLQWDIIFFYLLTNSL